MISQWMVLPEFVRPLGNRILPSYLVDYSPAICIGRPLQRYNLPYNVFVYYQ